MEKKKKYEAAYAGYVYEKPSTFWTSTDEVKKRLTECDFTTPNGIKKGGMPILFDGEKAYIDADQGHTAIVACSGMGKTINAYLPLLSVLARAEEPENIIATDPKGELFNRTAGWLKSNGYRVLCLDFRTMDKDCFNVLDYAASVYRNGDKDKGLSLLSDIINMLAENQRKYSRDPFWVDTGVSYVNATGAVMLDSFPEKEQVNILNWSDFNVRDSAEVLEKYILPVMPDNTVKVALKQCLSSAENTFRSILITASSFLSMFYQNPKLAAMLSYSTFTLEDLTKPKTALFLVTDDITHDGSERPLCSHAELMMLEKTWDYKEAIYMNLSEGIRYCTMLPSIDAYKIDGYPVPSYNSDPPAIKTYTVVEFAADVASNNIHAPFSPEEKKSSQKGKRNKRSRKQAMPEESSSDSTLDEELMRKYNQLFGSCENN